MQLGDHENNEGHDAKWAAVGPALLAVSVMLIGCIVTFLVLNLEALRPKVGDMVVFHPTSQEQDAWKIDVPMYRPGPNGQTMCTMDPAVIVQQGGSLVVEARDDATPAAQYRLHWAGPHSAQGAGDCAGSADLAVSRVDLQKLANAAGGFGVETGVVR
jgi:hypothetical protein